MRALTLTLRILACALLAGLILTPFAQIIARGVLDLPMAGAEEFARYLLVCLTFLAAALVTIEGGQIRMEEFQALIPPRPRWLLQLAVEASGVIVFALLAVAALVTIARNFRSATATLEISFPLFMGPLALGATLLALAALWQLRGTLRRGRPDDKHTTLT